MALRNGRGRRLWRSRSQASGGTIYDIEPSLALVREVLETSPPRESVRGRMLVVMIPAFNEAATVGEVVRKVPRRIAGIDVVRVLVVDDGSDDNTELEARRAGADHVLHHGRNVGLGVSFRDGLEFALAWGADVVVNIDADEQYDPAEIPKLVGPIVQDGADVVLGDRDVARVDHVPRLKRIGNKIATGAIRRATRLPIVDGQTGFRALSRDAGLRLNLQETYTFTHEMLFQVAEHNLRLRYVPVSFQRRNGNSRLIPTIWTYLKNASGALIRGYAAYRPLRLFGSVSSFFLALAVALGAWLFLHPLSGSPLGMTPLSGEAAIVALLAISAQAALTGVLAEAHRSDRRAQAEILYRLRKVMMDRERARQGVWALPDDPTVRPGGSQAEPNSGPP